MKDRVLVSASTCSGAVCSPPRRRHSRITQPVNSTSARRRNITSRSDPDFSPCCPPCDGSLRGWFRSEVILARK
ncbi:uncharacterized protein B0H18DRAFT_1009205 [Fomitopsis serialis]|uniref:uncharacterized protein n=1 Tax=Fomitopsis serialis TaxID=139415 RepID=UPI0020082AA0|nr:uncharacterized protein B0H18DRAFT_1009205 [Neoantrodia serialis]KAH9925233.1 hypothetical protein B0H18DRAFT_1009205 [Neoantrodia serialis]